MKAVLLDDAISLWLEAPASPGYACVAELSLISDPEALAAVLPEDYRARNWFYFNRLYTPPPARNQGLASQVLGALRELARHRQVSVVNTVNPYGDLDMAQLERLFCKYGFRRLRPGIVVMEN